MDAALGQIAGNFRPRVISAKGFLVDVLFKDIAQHIGVDLIRIPARRVVQVPRKAGEQLKNSFERRVRHRQRRAHARTALCVQLQRMVQKQAAVEVGNLPRQRPRLGAALGLGLGKGFKKQRVEEFAKEAIGAAPLTLL